MHAQFSMLMHVGDLQLQRTRPKGLIDLTYSTVYEVHESLFGRYVQRLSLNK